MASVLEGLQLLEGLVSSSVPLAENHTLSGRFQEVSECSTVVRGP